MRRLTFFLAAVLLVLVAREAPCRELTFSIDPNDRNSLRYSDMRVEEADPLSITTGRFLSVDPGRDWDPKQPQSWNMYAYVRNNPINRIDPTGRTCSDPNFIGPCRPTAEVTLAPPRNAANWTPEQRAAENAKNAHRAQLAEEGKLVVNRNQVRPSSAQVAQVNGGPAPAGMHLDHPQDLVLDGPPLSKANMGELDGTVNTSNGARTGNAVRPLANGTVITKFNYTVLNAGGLVMTAGWALSYNIFMQNQEKAHSGYVNMGDMMVWVVTGDTRASPPPCGTPGGGYC